MARWGVFVFRLEAQDGRIQHHELLESTHNFPSNYQIKVIGSVDNDFESRVVEAIRGEVGNLCDLGWTLRKTPDEKHLSLTIDVYVQSAAQVIEIYDRIRGLEGLRFLL